MFAKYPTPYSKSRRWTRSSVDVEDSTTEVSLAVTIFLLNGLYRYQSSESNTE